MALAPARQTVTYETWEHQLHGRADAWARHCELTKFLVDVPVGTDRRAMEFVEWARGLLTAANPRRNFPGVVPQWP